MLAYKKTARERVRKNFGGADGIRTHDLLDAIEARSQLRHGPTGEYFKSLSHPAGNLAASCASHTSRAGFRKRLDVKQPRRYPDALNSKASADIERNWEGMQVNLETQMKRAIKLSALAGAAFLAALLSLPLAAQQTGPLPPPPAYSAPTPTPAPQPGYSPAPTSAPHQTTTESPLSTDPPKFPPDQIIQKFAARELEFKKERDNYTYTQTVVVQTIDDYSGQPDGEYRLVTDIVFNPQGKRSEHDTFAPASSLQRIMLDEQDKEDLERVQPFVLTTDELPKYDVKYVGQQQLDELSTYVFDVAPKKIEKNQRYFQGRIWVEQQDMGIVKTDGKAVPDIRKRGSEHLYPRFETFRENIEGKYWFPTYTHADDTLQFSGGGIHMRMTVRYENYKRFGSTIKIGPATEAPKEKP